jgi:hypothetical protein
MSAFRVAPDEVFRALDGQHLSLIGGEWDVCVFSVTDAHDQRWVQLALEGQGLRILTLRLEPTHHPREAFASLSIYLADPLASSDVLSHVA